MDRDQWLSCTDPIAMVEFLRGSPTAEDSVTWWNNRWQLDAPSRGADRKFRLFACACCRRVWDRIPESCNRDAVAAVEDFLDGRLPGGALWEALVASSAVEYREDGLRRSEPGYWAVKYLGRGFYKMTAAASALLVASRVLSLADEGYGREIVFEFDTSFYSGAGVFLRPLRWPSPVPASVEAERATLSALLRCLFGDPFRPLPPLSTSLPAWNGGIIPELAQAAYDDRRMPEGTLNAPLLAVLADALEEAGRSDPEMLAHLRGPGRHVRGCWVVDAILGRA